MNEIIKVSSLTKTYKLGKREIKAVRNVSFVVNEGEIFAILGPNGAGKTTLIKMLSTLVLPTSGKAFVCGYDIVKDEAKVRKCIGLSTGFERSFYYRLTGFQNLKFFGTLYGMRGRSLNDKIKELSDFFNLNDAKEMLYMKYSTGMKKRLSLARALIHNPKILMLDEPTSSIDPKSAMEIRQRIKEIKKDKAVILATHDLHEAETIADRIAILKDGRLLTVDSPTNLKRYLKHEIIKIKTDGSVSMDKDFFLENGMREKIKRVDVKDETVFIHVENTEEVMDYVVDKMKSMKVKLLKINVEEPSLEEVFLNFMGEKDDKLSD